MNMFATCSYLLFFSDEYENVKSFIYAIYDLSIFFSKKYYDIDFFFAVENKYFFSALIHFDFSKSHMRDLK